MKTGKRFFLYTYCDYNNNSNYLNAQFILYEIRVDIYLPTIPSYLRIKFFKPTNSHYT